MRRWPAVIMLLLLVTGGIYAYIRYSPRRLPTPPPPPSQGAVPPPVDIKPQPDPPPLEPVLSWYFIRNQEHKTPGYPSEAREILRKYNIFYTGDTGVKEVYLTFDEGYEYGFTPRILDTLRDNGVKAAFFITDHFLKSNPGLVERMLQEGHIVGNHSVTHPSFPTLEDAAVTNEVKALEDNYRAKTGRRMKYFRFPEGAYSERTVKIIDRMGYKIIFWSLAYLDWDVNAQKGAQYAYDQVMPNLHNGAIILLHAVSESNTDALDKILKDAKAQGYEFATLDKLR